MHGGPPVAFSHQAFLKSVALASGLHWPSAESKVARTETDHNDLCARRPIEGTEGDPCQSRTRRHGGLSFSPAENGNAASPTDATDRGGSRSPPFSIVCSASRRQRRGLETHKGQEVAGKLREARSLRDLYHHRHRARGRRARSGCAPSPARRAPSRTARPPAVASPTRPAGARIQRRRLKARTPHRAPWMGRPSRRPGGP